jgi:hypothetical protein
VVVVVVMTTMTRTVTIIINPGNGTERLFCIQLNPQSEHHMRGDVP